MRAAESQAQRCRELLPRPRRKSIGLFCGAGVRVYGFRAGAIDALRGAKALCTRLRPFSSGLGFCLVACSLLQGLGAYRG